MMAVGSITYVGMNWKLFLNLIVTSMIQEEAHITATVNGVTATPDCVESQIDMHLVRRFSYAFILYSRA